MKNLKYAYKLLLVLPLIFMVSCDDSDDIIDVLTQTSTTTENTVFIEIEDASEVAVNSTIGVSNTITVGINNEVSSETTVSFSVTKDGGPAVLGTDYNFTDVTILSDETQGSSDITFLTLGIYEVVINSSSNSTLNVVANKAIFNVRPPFVTATWDDPYYDYDLYLVTGDQDFGGTVLAWSLGITNFESMNYELPEGTTSIYIQDYWGDNASIPVALTIQTSDSTEEVFEIIMDMSKWVVTIETVINEDGTRTHTVTPL